jgi:hypothetical protein
VIECNTHTYRIDRITLLIFNGNITYSRDWWVSESTPRTIEEEVQATNDLINLAYEAIKKPVYLVYGHDNGVLASRVKHVIECNTHTYRIDRITLLIFNCYISPVCTMNYNSNTYCSFNRTR